MSVAFRFVFILCFSMHRVTSTSHSKFVEDMNGYRSVCKSIGLEPKQSCTGSVIAFHASLKNHLRNVPVNTIIKFEKVHLNKGNGYDPATGVFIAPEDGVYSFAWSFVTGKGDTMYLAAVVDNQVQANTCIDKQQSSFINTSGHFIQELKRGNKVWIRTWYETAKLLNANHFSYFSGYKIISN
uniref:C1q domain-containing protein n=1 Tax=Magallana gigas TaxID=29159 RepID=A0A8W8LVP7_MAGGI